MSPNLVSIKFYLEDLSSLFLRLTQELFTYALAVGFGVLVVVPVPVAVPVVDSPESVIGGAGLSTTYRT